jgi:hypothetical protein
MDSNSHPAVRAIREAGMTLKGWARNHGFSVSTVAAAIYGRRGVDGKRGPRANRSEAVRAALIKDGYWPTDEDDTADHTGPHRH